MDDSTKKSLYICGGILGVSILTRILLNRKDEGGKEIPRGLIKMKAVRSSDASNMLEATDDAVPDKTSDYVPAGTPIKRAELKTNMEAASTQEREEAPPEISLETEATSPNGSDSQATPTVASENAANTNASSTKVYTAGSDEINMIVCPTGSYSLRTTPIKTSPQYAIPVRNVEFKAPFMISENEVTQNLYKHIMGVNPSWFNGMNKLANIDYGIDLNRPVEFITWFDAIVFCNKLSEKVKLTPCYSIKNPVMKSVERDGMTQSIAPYIVSAQVTWDKNANGFRLPTEEEWQYAALSNSNFTFSGSDKVTDVAWFADNSSAKTQAVGSKNANAWGLYDMSGNVWEMCWDLAEPNNPSGISRVVKGGGFDSNGLLLILNPSIRASITRSNNTGFRLAKNNS